MDLSSESPFDSPGPTNRPHSDVGPVFRAYYDGECGLCGDLIEEGDDCRMYHSSIAHAACAEGDDDPGY